MCGDVLGTEFISIIEKRENNEQVISSIYL